MPAESSSPAAGWRRRVPSLAAFLDRPNDALDRAIFLGLVGLAGAFALYGGGLAESAVGLLTAAQIALFVWALAAGIRFLTRRGVDALGYPLAAALVALVLVLDRIYYSFFREHMTPAVARQALGAVRAGALRLDFGAVAAVVGASAALGVILTVLLKLLARIPRSARAASLAARGALPGLLIVGSAASLRDCAFDPLSAASLSRRAVPWDGASYGSEAPPVATPGRDAALFGEDLPFAEAQRNGEGILSGPLAARVRPDILFIHLESLRADMLRPDVTPTLSALAGGPTCVSTPFHFTTGTNTGTGVFGLLHGMTAPYFPLAREAHAQPLPLRILRKLGYDVSVFFSNNFRTYDDLFALFFEGIAGYAYDGPKEPVWDADAKMVDAWRARLPKDGGGAPRFDYVIIDSTHYDYSYPPDFERFKPAMTLDLGFRDGLVVEEGINEKLKWRAPFVRNRYQNSILYADSLVARMLTALRETHRLERTIVVVTGDHGEEFWERGAFGHGFHDLSNEQARVPFLICLPDGGASRYRYSSHADVFPTIFDAMGLSPFDRPFMNGKSLLRYDAALDLAVIGFGVSAATGRDHRLAVAGEGLKVYFQNLTPFPVTEVTRDDDEPIAVPADPKTVDGLVFRAVAMKGAR